jgi:hypothetical protein
MKKVVIGVVIGLVIFNIKKIIVLGMIVVGAVIVPEASTALSHYCFGDGDTLFVESDYIRTSPVVINELKTLRDGEKRRVGMRQCEDWRLSYAINPFNIERKGNKVIISQWMQFDTTNVVTTQFGPFKINDNIVHEFECTPYLFYHEFEYDETVEPSQLALILKRLTK